MNLSKINLYVGIVLIVSSGLFYIQLIFSSEIIYLPIGFFMSFSGLFLVFDSTKTIKESQKASQSLDNVGGK